AEREHRYRPRISVSAVCDRVDGAVATGRGNHIEFGLRLARQAFGVADAQAPAHHHRAAAPLESRDDLAQTPLRAAQPAGGGIGNDQNASARRIRRQGGTPRWPRCYRSTSGTTAPASTGPRAGYGGCAGRRNARRATGVRNRGASDREPAPPVPTACRMPWA